MMLPRCRMTLLVRLGLGVVWLMAVVAMAGCQHAPVGSTEAMVARAPGTQPSALATISADELRSVLSDLARAHEQKLQLAAWVALPFVGPPVNASIKPFYRRMGEQQLEMSKQLREIAKEHQIDLAFRAGTDVAGRAMAIMEKRQEKMVRADGVADFDRDMLMQMYNDYEWQICVLQALLPTVKDAGLRAYVEASLKVHEEGSAEIVGYLKRFKIAGS